MSGLLKLPTFDSDGAEYRVSSAIAHPRYHCLQSAVVRLQSAGVALAEPVEIREWNGGARHGRFVKLDAMTFALHVGRGRYITVDIERDLNGVTPSEATALMLCRSGAVREPDRQRGFNLAR